jgi:hypothetical protein
VAGCNWLCSEPSCPGSPTRLVDNDIVRASTCAHHDLHSLFVSIKTVMLQIVAASCKLLLAKIKTVICSDANYLPAGYIGLQYNCQPIGGWLRSCSTVNCLETKPSSPKLVVVSCSMQSLIFTISSPNLKFGLNQLSPVFAHVKSLKPCW